MQFETLSLTSPPPLAADSGAQLQLSGSLDRHIPDVTSVFADGPVGGEPAHVGDVEDAHARPVGCRLPQLVDPALRPIIGVEIRGDHIIVMVAQGIRKWSKAAAIIVTKQAGFERVHRLGELRRRSDGGCRIASVAAALLHLVRLETEDKDVVHPDTIANLDIGPVEGPNRERAVERKLHVARAGRFHPCGRDLLGQIGRRNDRLGQAHVVIRNEGDLAYRATPGRCSRPPRRRSRV